MFRGQQTTTNPKEYVLDNGSLLRVQGICPYLYGDSTNGTVGVDGQY